jgi:hypothetical protein
MDEDRDDERGIYLTPAQRLEAQKALNKIRRTVLDRLTQTPKTLATPVV